MASQSFWFPSSRGEEFQCINRVLPYQIVISARYLNISANAAGLVQFVRESFHCTQEAGV